MSSTCPIDCLPQRKEVTELKCKLENSSKAREGPCCMPSSQPVSSGLPSCSLEGNFYQMVFETASIIQEIAGRAERRRGQCMQGILLRPERLSRMCFPTEIAPSTHSSGGACGTTPGAILFCCAQHRRGHFGFSRSFVFKFILSFCLQSWRGKSCKLNSSLPWHALPCPAVPSSANSSASFLLKLRV